MNHATPTTIPMATDLFAMPAPKHLPKAMATWVTRPLQRLTGLCALQQVYNRIATTSTPVETNFFDRALNALNVQVKVSPEDLARIPQTGPVVLVANHPFGGIEGLVLGKLLLAARPDSKLMANYLLGRIPELRPALIQVDPFGGNEAGRRNLGPMRECLSWLRQGGALGIFPSGEVAHSAPRRRFHVTESAWSPNIAGLIRRTGATVIPVHFAGHNGALFQTLGLLSARLRTAMLAREIVNKRDATLSVRMGEPIPASRLDAFRNDQDAAQYLRLRTAMLAPKKEPAKHALLPLRRRVPATVPVAGADAPARLRQELATLPPEQRLLETDDFAVYCAPAAEIPLLLREIGRLREITFRAVGEGTGKELDLDRFDQSYLHLFVWHKEKGEIAGAYRLGRMDEIMARDGIRGLYTRTLFRYHRAYIQQLGPTLEMGRSFVRLEYQRSFSPLLLLWKGIGQYVVANPQYKQLLGPVSVSNEYQPLSRHLLAAFLQARHGAVPAGGPVKGKHAMRVKAVGDVEPKIAAGLVANMDELSALIADIEPDGKGVPVLVRQYIKLGGVIHALNVDPAFFNSLDGLVLVDLKQTEPRLLEKYLGKLGAPQFLAWHQEIAKRPAAA